MGNFKVPETTTSCVKYRAGGDGYVVTGKVATYFPNGMGLYDVVGNVAEMLHEKGKAAGGSWNHHPEESTMTTINTYTDTDGAIGFGCSWKFTRSQILNAPFDERCWKLIARFKKCDRFRR